MQISLDQPVQISDSVQYLIRTRFWTVVVQLMSEKMESISGYPCSTHGFSSRKVVVCFLISKNFTVPNEFINFLEQSPSTIHTKGGLRTWEPPANVPCLRDSTAVLHAFIHPLNVLLIQCQYNLASMIMGFDLTV